MNPYLVDQLVKARVSQLHREAERYRLAAEVGRRARRVSTSTRLARDEVSSLSARERSGNSSARRKKRGGVATKQSLGLRRAGDLFRIDFDRVHSLKYVRAIGLLIVQTGLA